MASARRYPVVRRHIERFFGARRAPERAPHRSRGQITAVLHARSDGAWLSRLATKSPSSIFGASRTCTRRMSSRSPPRCSATTSEHQRARGEARSRAIRPYSPRRDPKSRPPRGSPRWLWRAPLRSSQRYSEDRPHGLARPRSRPWRLSWNFEEAGFSDRPLLAEPVRSASAASACDERQESARVEPFPNGGRHRRRVRTVDPFRDSQASPVDATTRLIVRFAQNPRC